MGRVGRRFRAGDVLIVISVVSPTFGLCRLTKYPGWICVTITEVVSLSVRDQYNNVLDRRKRREKGNGAGRHVRLGLSRRCQRTLFRVRVLGRTVLPRMDMVLSIFAYILYEQLATPNIVHLHIPS